MPIYVTAPGLHCVSFRRPRVGSAASIALPVGAAIAAAVAPAIVAMVLMVMVDRPPRQTVQSRWT
ncbi:hypothetical protein GGD64_004906 [Bradyrhizobium sp. CIR3A]|nr:hypothetical protein [Bradyrhizobium sp. CIR3A]